MSSRLFCSSFALVSASLCAFACDAASPPAPASPALTAAPVTWYGEPPAHADERDPLVRAITRVTSVLSYGGLSIHDYEWGEIHHAVTQTRLPRERFFDVVDRLAVAAPWPIIWSGELLPEAYRIRGRFPDAPAHKRAWSTDGLHVAEQVAIYALPHMMRARLTAMYPPDTSAVVYVAAHVLRDDAGTPVLAEVTVAVSDCGWCSDGNTWTLAPDGKVVAVRSEQAWSAYGYCC